MLWIIIVLSAVTILITLLSAFCLHFALVRIEIVKSRKILREKQDDIEKHARLSERAIQLKHEKLRIESHDKLKLCAYMFPADIPTSKTVICVHGYRGSGLHDHSRNLFFYHECGYNVLIPDDRAHGESEGRYIGFGWLDRLDCVRWCEYLADYYGEDCEILLHGISMGSAAVICASAEHPPALKGVVADCPYANGFEQFRHVTRKFLRIPAFPLLYTTALMTRIVCGYSLRKCSPIESITRAEVPFLFIHGGDDHFVPTEMSKRLYDACPTDKELLIIEGAKHGESNFKDPERYYDAVVKFLERINF
jgi:fermentation-respiration switch protein FrsA (DUF1100 family)